MENNFVNQVIKFVTWIPLILAILLILVVIYAIFEPNTFPAWTGFPKTNSIFEKFLAPKTLWDWLDLVIVPFTIAFGVYLLNRREDRRVEAMKRLEEERNELRQKLEKEREEIRQEQEKERQEDNQHEVALQGYFDKMSELILKWHLVKTISTEQHAEDKDQQGTESKRADPNSRAAAIAKARTLAVLRILDPGRVSTVFRFLREAQLVDIVSFTDGDFRKVAWNEANLEGVNLSGTNLNRADLTRANLSWADLSGANLNLATLEGAKFIKANLSEAQIVTDLSGIDLKESNLSGAKLASAQYNAETKWPEGIDPEEEGAELLESD